MQTERYLRTCMRYIELNPVRAGMVRRPEEYRWSSYGAKAWGDHHWLTPHSEYQRLIASRWRMIVSGNRLKNGTPPSLVRSIADERWMS